MRIPYKTRLLIAISVLTVVFIAGCVDTSINPLPSSVDYSSQISIVNLVSGAGTATLTLDGQSLGAVAFGSEYPGQLPFLTVPSGNKVLGASFTTAASQEYRFAASTEYKQRIYLVGTAAKSEVVRVSQRYIWQTKDSPNGAALFPADTAWVAFFNGSPNALINGVTINGDETTFATPLATGKGASYIKLAAGSYTFDVLYDDASHLTFDYTVGSKGRYTTVLYDSAATLQSAVFIDD